MLLARMGRDERLLVLRQADAGPFPVGIEEFTRFWEEQ